MGAGGNRLSRSAQQLLPEFFLASQVDRIVQIITLEDVMRTYAQAKRKYGKSYLQKVRKYSETCIVTTQKKIYHSSHHNLASVPSPYFEQAK